jgi:hypothetical protein
VTCTIELNQSMNRRSETLVTGRNTSNAAMNAIECSVNRNHLVTPHKASLLKHQMRDEEAVMNVETSSGNGRSAPYL